MMLGSDSTKCTFITVVTKLFIKESSMLALKSPNKITFSYLFKCISKLLETEPENEIQYSHYWDCMSN